MSFDDPFNRDTDGHWNMRNNSRTRSSLVPLRSRIHRWNNITGATQSDNSSIGYRGLSQGTNDSRWTGWPTRNRLLRSPHLDDQFKNLIRRQNYGGYFFSKQISMSELPNKMGYSGSFSVLSETGEGWRWPCINAYSKSRSMDFGEDAWRAVKGATLSELFQYGGTGIAATLPTVPESSVVTMLGELARDLPKLPGTSFKKRPTLGGVADEFLNYTFGISPTLSDMKSVASTTANAQKILEQYRRDSNRLVRRRVTLHESEEVVSSSSHRALEFPFGYLYIDPLRNKIGNCEHKTTISKRVWFSGAYQYSIPGLETKLAKLSEFNRLYGVIPTAEDLWNLTPWSWLIDWFFTTNSFMRNVSTLSRDGIRIHHAYVMMEIVKSTTYTNFGNTVTFDEISRNRVRASPFGFGFRPGSLSDKQKAILSALAISRWDN